MCSACVYTLILTTVERETDRYWNEIFCMCTTLDCKVSKEKKKRKKLCNFNGVKTCPRNQKGAKKRFLFNVENQMEMEKIQENHHLKQWTQKRV